MKKLLAVILIVFMLFVTGCTDDGTSSKTSKAITKSGSETTVSGETGVSTTTAVTTSNGTAGNNNDISAVDSVNSVTKAGRTIAINPIATTMAKWSPALAVSTKTIGSTMVSQFTGDTYELKWIDDFNGTSLNMSNWNYQKENANGSEIQKNLPENAVVKDGVLSLWGKKGSTAYTVNGKTSYYTGSTINSKDRRVYKYGRIEARIKSPKGDGMWPAFWSVGNTKPWPWGGEIDMYEFNGGRGRDAAYLSGIHWCAPDCPQDLAYTDAGHKSDGTAFTMPSNQGNTLSENYHVYGVEWNDTKLIYYFDGMQVQTLKISTPDKKVAFHLAHYLILNMAMGGQSGSPAEANDTTVPQAIQFDWVKLWQK